MPVEYKDNEYNNANIIKSVSDNQYEIFHNIQKLYLNGDPFECDVTYSKGNFYGQHGEYNIIPPKYKFDVNPIVEGVEKIDPLGKWPLEINSLKSINVDLPFVVSGDAVASYKNKTQNELPENSCLIYRRFSGYYPAEEMFKSYYHFLYNSFKYLQPGGFCVWKCQSTVSGGKKYWTPYYSWQVASDLGFYPRDEFILTAKTRILGRIKKQEHARCFHSHFLVFQKPDGRSKTKPIDYFKWQK